MMASSNVFSPSDGSAHRDAQSQDIVLGTAWMSKERAGRQGRVEKAEWTGEDGEDPGCRAKSIPTLESAILAYEAKAQSTFTLGIKVWSNGAVTLTPPSGACCSSEALARGRDPAART